MAKRRALEALDANRLLSTTPRPTATTPKDRSIGVHANTKKSERKRKSSSGSSKLWNTETKTPRISNCAEKASILHRQKPRKTAHDSKTTQMHAKNEINDENDCCYQAARSTSCSEKPLSSHTVAERSLDEPRQARRAHTGEQKNKFFMDVESPAAFSALSGLEDNSPLGLATSNSGSYMEQALNRLGAIGKMTPATKKKRKKRIGISKSPVNPDVGEQKKSSALPKQDLDPKKIAVQKSLEPVKKLKECERKFVHFEEQPQPERLPEATIQEPKKQTFSPVDEEVFEALNNGPPHISQNSGPMIGCTIGGFHMERIDPPEDEDLTVDGTYDELKRTDFSGGVHQYSRQGHSQRESGLIEPSELQCVGTQNAETLALDEQVAQNKSFRLYIARSMFYDELDCNEEGPSGTVDFEGEEVGSPLPFDEPRDVICFPEVWSLPDDETSVNSKNFIFEIKGKKYYHPALPPGWKLKTAKSQDRPFYIHPDHGITYYCPVPLPVMPHGTDSGGPYNRKNYVSGAARKPTQALEHNARLLSNASPGGLYIACSPNPWHQNAESKGTRRNNMHQSDYDSPHLSFRQPEGLQMQRAIHPPQLQKCNPGFDRQQDNSPPLVIGASNRLKISPATDRLENRGAGLEPEERIPVRKSPQPSAELPRTREMSQLSHAGRKPASAPGLTKHPLEIGISQWGSEDFTEMQSPDMFHYQQRHPSQSNGQSLSPPSGPTSTPPGLKLKPLSSHAVGKRGNEDTRHGMKIGQSNGDLSPSLSPPSGPTYTPPGLKLKPLSFHAVGKRGEEDTRHGMKTDGGGSHHHAYAKGLLAPNVIGDYDVNDDTNSDNMIVCSQSSEDLFSTESSKETTPEMAQTETDHCIVAFDEHLKGFPPEPSEVGFPVTPIQPEGHPSLPNAEEQVITVKHQHRHRKAEYFEEMERESDKRCSRIPQHQYDCRAGTDGMPLNDDDQVDDTNARRVTLHKSSGDNDSNGELVTSPKTEDNLVDDRNGMPLNDSDIDGADVDSNGELVTSLRTEENLAGGSDDMPLNESDTDDADVVSNGELVASPKLGEDADMPLNDSDMEDADDDSHKELQSTASLDGNQIKSDTSSPSISITEQDNAKGTGKGILQSTSRAPSDNEENGNAPKVATVTVLSHGMKRKKGIPESTALSEKGVHDEVSPGPRVVNLDEESFIQRDEEPGDNGIPAYDSMSEEEEHSRIRKSISPGGSSLVGCSLSPIENEESLASPQLSSNTLRLCSLQNVTSCKRNGRYASTYRFAAVAWPSAFQEKANPRKKH